MWEFMQTHLWCTTHYKVMVSCVSADEELGSGDRGLAQIIDCTGDSLQLCGDVSSDEYDVATKWIM